MLNVSVLFFSTENYLIYHFSRMDLIASREMHLAKHLNTYVSLSLCLRLLLSLGFGSCPPINPNCSAFSSNKLFHQNCAPKGFPICSVCMRWAASRYSFFCCGNTLHCQRLSLFRLWWNSPSCVINIAELPPLDRVSQIPCPLLVNRKILRIQKLLNYFNKKGRLP